MTNSDLPSRVRSTIAFFERHKLWYVLTRNSAATSCRDAVARRHRLGVQGIPLYDELKSFCGVAQRSDGSRQVVLCHCRANTRFDMDAVGRLLHSRGAITRLPEHELSKSMAEYGTVNPFSEAHQYLHVFDEDVFARYTPPHTMMTNAGDRTWAVEFRPSDAMRALCEESSGVLVGRIRTCQSRSRLMPKIGLITGNPPNAGMVVWRSMNEEIHARSAREQRFCNELVYPKVVVHSLPDLGLSMGLPARRDDVWNVLRESIAEMIDAGVTHLALACNAAHYYSERIQQICPPGVAFVSMVDTVAEFVVSKAVGELTIVGLPVVATLGEFSGYRKLSSLGIQPLDPGVTESIRELALHVRRLEDPSWGNKALNRLQHALRAGVPTSKVLLAMNEASVLLERFPQFRERLSGKALIDSLRLYGKALADIYVDALPEDESARYKYVGEGT